MKVCGYISTSDNKLIVEERLKSTISVMKHEPEAVEQAVCFDKGGIAIINTSPTDTSSLAWDEDHFRCLALCGHVVDTRIDNTSSSAEMVNSPVVNSASLLISDFAARGEDLLGELNGVFAIAYYDSASQTLTLANDRFGFMPLYYYYNHGLVVFASEVKAILQLVPQRELDWESCADFFYVGHMLGQKTLFKNIHALEAGQVLTYTNGNLETRRYYDFTHTPIIDRKDVSVEKLARLFTEAVRRRVRTELPNTVLLSGGFDSRFILGTLDSVGVSPKVVSLEHANVKQGLDGKLALLLANALRLEYDYRRSHKHYFTSQDWLQVFYILDGMTPNLELFISEVYPELTRSLGVVWDGLALDIALGGSHQIEGGTQENIKEFISKRTANRFLLRLILSPSKFHEMDNTFIQRLQDEVAQIPPSENQFEYFLLKHRTRRRIAVNPYQLFASKVSSMTPAADTNFMQYILSIPSSLKLDHKLYVNMLRETFPLLTKVPLLSGVALYDLNRTDSPKNRPGKKGLLKKTLKQIKNMLPPGIREIVMNYVYKYRGLTYDPQSVKLIVHVLSIKNFDRPFYNKVLLRRLFESYRNGNLVYHRLFEIVFYIELWHLLFIDKDSPILFNPNELYGTPTEMSTG